MDFFPTTFFFPAKFFNQTLVFLIGALKQDCFVWNFWINKLRTNYTKGPSLSKAVRDTSPPSTSRQREGRLKNIRRKNPASNFLVNMVIELPFPPCPPVQRKDRFSFSAIKLSELEAPPLGGPAPSVPSSQQRRAAHRAARWRRQCRAEVGAKATFWAISCGRCAERCPRSHCRCPANASFALNSCRNV